MGALKPGKVYTTQVIMPAISYWVPDKGWFNYEDTPGNFLLLPPGNSLPDVDAGESDYLGIYSVIAPAEFIRQPECVPVFVPGIAPTPAGMAAWLRGNPVVSATRPVAATAGGLDGLVLDLRVKPGARLPRCRNGLTFFSAELLFRGLPPSTVAHGLVPGMTMRLYLLPYDDRVLAVELVDTRVGPGSLQTLSNVVDHITFSQ